MMLFFPRSGMTIFCQVCVCLCGSVANKFSFPQLHLNLKIFLYGLYYSAGGLAVPEVYFGGLFWRVGEDFFDITFKRFCRAELICSFCNGNWALGVGAQR
jgi:hypothetical protein